ncbi:unnamed protein product [Moneuplotes crassus]|uniref:Uncharacterized protein n=1 Tax=Euplotes crassus TaxID=5936 RepID=A0AAD1Y6I4_EUPCR|nr:unnamed protein product [Moneuplotes crassus]
MEEKRRETSESGFYVQADLSDEPSSEGFKDEEIKRADYRRIRFKHRTKANKSIKNRSIEESEGYVNDTIRRSKEINDARSETRTEGKLLHTMGYDPRTKGMFRNVVSSVFKNKSQNLPYLKNKTSKLNIGNYFNKVLKNSATPDPKEFKKLPYKFSKYPSFEDYHRIDLFKRLQERLNRSLNLKIKKCQNSQSPVLVEREDNSYLQKTNEVDNPASRSLTKKINLERKKSRYKINQPSEVKKYKFTKTKLEDIFSANRVKRNQNLRKYNLTTFSQKSDTMPRDDQIREKNDKCTKKWISPFINFKMTQNYKGRNHDFIRQQLSESFENIKNRYLQEQGRIKAAELKSHMTDMPRREHPKIIPIKKNTQFISLKQSKMEEITKSRNVSAAVTSYIDNKNKTLNSQLFFENKKLSCSSHVSRLIESIYERSFRRNRLNSIEELKKLFNNTSIVRHKKERSREQEFYEDFLQ